MRIRATFTLLFVLFAGGVASADNILYLNSTRGGGTGSLGSFRSAIADALDNYNGGGVFNVDFVQTHVTGTLATKIASNAIGFYDQIWFDTTILNTSLLDAADLAALNAWAANDQPEFILDSSFFFRNKLTTTASATAAAVTVNEALALQGVGGGILIGTDHNQFAHTANQVLTNFGFDGLFTGSFNITANGAFVGTLLTSPETVGADFFPNHLQSLSTSNVPIGTHNLNANGGNRTIEIVENLWSNSPTRISHIGASFDTGDLESPITDPAAPVPEPGTMVLVALGAVALRRKLR